MNLNFKNLLSSDIAIESLAIRVYQGGYKGGKTKEEKSVILENRKERINGIYKSADTDNFIGNQETGQFARDNNRGWKRKGRLVKIVKVVKVARGEIINKTLGKGGWR